MTIDITNPAMQLINIPGIWPLLVQFAGVSAQERGSSSMEPIDLVIAIFIIDLEHVEDYWSDWRQFEEFVLRVPMAEGRKRTFLHRHYHAFRVWSAAEETMGQLTFYPSPSSLTIEIAKVTHELAQSRSSEIKAPTSCDFLYSICSIDLALSASLQEAGLQLSKLEKDVK